ncbi:MAG: hypothetical protein GW938_10550 [Leptospira sp.]|nr:hypothetical protein [Leptospira sp.]NCS93030.1 hypothetical protein [Leptospira sp.]
MLASLSISPLTIYHPHNGEILWHLDKLSISPGWTGIVGRNGSVIESLTILKKHD